MRKIVRILRQVLQRGPNPASTPNIERSPEIIPRAQHTLSRKHISKSALKVLYRLHDAGFAAYLVGGSVRDLLLGLCPKDFDVVTNALPEDIQWLFRNSFIIGRRFRLVHVRFGHEIIEVATFRGNAQNSTGQLKTQHGVLLRDNVYGTLEDDVWRRDFTVNALYYNIADFSVVDYVGGMADLEKRCLRVIGDPNERYLEDPARMLRAIRLAGKLDFTIEPCSAAPIKGDAGLLRHIPPARLFDKVLKIFHSGKSYATFQLLLEYGVFAVLFPHVVESFAVEINLRFVEEALKNTDSRVKAHKRINSAFLLAVILWGPLQEQHLLLQRQEETESHQAWHMAMTEVLKDQLRLIAIPRKFATVMREIWHLQYHLENPRQRRIYKVFAHPKFRAAYDFLMLRVAAGESAIQAEAQWWTHFQEHEDCSRAQLIADRFGKSKKRRRRRKRVENGTSLPSVGE